MKRVFTDDCIIRSKWRQRAIPELIGYGYRMVACAKNGKMIMFAMFHENGDRLFDFWLNDNDHWKLNDVFFLALEKFGYKW